MKRLESNQTEQSWFCRPIYFTGVNCRRQDFCTVPLIYVLRIYNSIHADQVYRKQYIRNIVRVLFSRGRHVHLKTYKQKNSLVYRWDCRCFERFSLGFLSGLFHARVWSINAFSFSSQIVLLETDYSSEAFKENINILRLLTGSFPPKPLKTIDTINLQIA